MTEAAAGAQTPGTRAARPRLLGTSELAELAAVLAAELHREGHVRDPERAARDIAAVAQMRLDGYQIAKKLDDEKGWRCDFEIAEILNGFSSMMRGALEKLEAKWARDNAIEPPHPVGTRIAIRTGAGVEYGVIESLYSHGAARYAVAIEGDPDAHGPKQSRRIVKFEHAVPA